MKTPPASRIAGESQSCGPRPLELVKQPRDLFQVNRVLRVEVLEQPRVEVGEVADGVGPTRLPRQSLLAIES